MFFSKQKQLKIDLAAKDQNSQQMMIRVWILQLFQKNLHLSVSRAQVQLLVKIAFFKKTEISFL